MAIRELKDQIARLPEQPGVYLYFNAVGETIYVGKARALRDRVRNYLGAYGADAKTDALLDEVARLEVIVTDSVVEALALENNLIKQRSPKYNIRLRDDKNYPYLQLTATEAFPRVLVARRFERDGIEIINVGSLQPYCHGEGEELYVTIDLDQLKSDPEHYRNKCVRIRLKEGELMDFEVDCLQLQVEHRRRTWT